MSILKRKKDYQRNFDVNNRTIKVLCYDSKRAQEVYVERCIKSAEDLHNLLRNYRYDFYKMGVYNIKVMTDVFDFKVHYNFVWIDNPDRWEYFDDESFKHWLSGKTDSFVVGRFDGKEAGLIKF